MALVVVLLVSSFSYLELYIFQMAGVNFVTYLLEMNSFTEALAISVQFDRWAFLKSLIFSELE